MSKSTAQARSLNKMWESSPCYSKRREQKPRANYKNCRLISSQLVIALKDKHIQATWLVLFSVCMIPLGWLMSECALIYPLWGCSCEQAHRNILLAELFSLFSCLPVSVLRVQAWCLTSKTTENKVEGLHLTLILLNVTPTLETFQKHTSEKGNCFSVACLFNKMQFSLAAISEPLPSLHAWGHLSLDGLQMASWLRYSREYLLSHYVLITLG